MLAMAQRSTKCLLKEASRTDDHNSSCPAFSRASTFFLTSLKDVDRRNKPAMTTYWFALGESSIALKASSRCGETATLSRSPLSSRLMNHFS